MAKSLPPNPNLEYLAKQAKELLRELRTAATGAIVRIRSQHPKFADQPDGISETSFRLADAQLVIAREYGFESWTKLKRRVEALTAESPVHEHVIGVEAFFSRFTIAKPSMPLVEWLQPQADLLLELHAQRNPVVVMVCQLNHMPAQRPTVEQLFESPMSLDDARQTIAAAYLFKSWSEVEAAEHHVEAHFEEAVEAVVAGRLEELQTLLLRHPELVHGRSPYAHRATLLHYVAANGVEIRRQRSPRRAAEIARLLLESGAEADQLCETYGGGASQTTLCLTVSSYHPHATGVQSEIVDVLLEYGAAIDGLENDGTPLATALAFGYQATAQVLARRGASIDNLVTAAGLGRVDLLESMLTADGELVQPQCYRDPFGELVQEAQALKDRAFFMACKQGLVEPVRLLLDRGANIDTAPMRSETALHWAAYEGHLAIVQLLVERGANLSARDQQWNCTPAVWAAEGNHQEIVEYLERRTETKEG